MSKYLNSIQELADGVRSSKDIAKLVGCTERNARKVMKNYSLPRPKQGGQRGPDNGSWAGGRHIDSDGYVVIPTPEGCLIGKKNGNMSEHRYILSLKLGRDLTQEEVVDHIDGLTLHNHPDNLRLFQKNSYHLEETITGKAHRVTPEGQLNIYKATTLKQAVEPVRTYQKRKAAGEIRERQILLAWLKLGVDSPYLLGTHRWLEKAGIDYSRRSNLVHALLALYQKWGWVQTP